MNCPSCPWCELSHSKRNGHTRSGKQNYQCLRCHRRFFANAQRVDGVTWSMVKRLLSERISWRGICRVVSVSMIRLLQCIAERFTRMDTEPQF